MARKHKTKVISGHKHRGHKKGHKGGRKRGHKK